MKEQIVYIAENGEQFVDKEACIERDNILRALREETPEDVARAARHPGNACSGQSCYTCEFRTIDSCREAFLGARLIRAAKRQMKKEEKEQEG